MTASVEPSSSPTSGRARAGSIDQTPSGSWRVRFRTPDGRRRSKVFPTQAEAELFRLGCEKLYGDMPSLTLEGFGEGWLEAREISREHRSTATTRSLWRTHIEGTPLATMLLKAVTRRDVRRWLVDLKGKKAMAPRRGKEAPTQTDRPISRSLARQAFVLLRQAFQAAVDDDLIEDNPARDVKFGRFVGSSDEGWTYLTAPELGRVLTSPGSPRWARLLHTVAAYTGLREGELWGLHWADVILAGPRPELVVRFSHAGPTKSGKVRRVPLFEPARAALEEWKAICPKHPDGLVFPSPTGERRPKSDDAGWADEAIRLRDRKPGGPTRRPGWKTLAGIARRVRFHDLRHTCASHLVMGTWGRAWKLEEVRDFLGHHSIVVTQKYAHLSPDHLANAAAATRPAPAAGSRLGHEPSAEVLNALVLQGMAFADRDVPIRGLV